ncbi:MAG: CDGSH iron-sulfur domain-containing protein [Leptospirales bacterium]
MKNGPYEAFGELTNADANGKGVSSQGVDTYHLCRCGGFKSKLMCDGTHERIQWQSE